MNRHEQIHAAFILYTAEHFIGPVPDADEAPTLAKLKTQFEAAHGEYRPIYDLEQRTFKPAAEYSNDGASPYIAFGVSPDDSTLIHELRHHDQTKLLGRKFRPSSLHELCRVHNLIEADARAVQALHLLEKIEHFRKNGCKTFNDIEGQVARLEASYCPGIKDIFISFLEGNPGGTFTRAQKFQVMKQVFDAYISVPVDRKPIYLDLQKQNIDMAWAVPRSWFAIAGAFLAGAITFLSGGVAPGLITAATAALFCGTLAKESAKRVFNYCANPPASETAALLKKLGELPGGGNYLTQTQGTALDSAFYHDLSPETEARIQEKYAELQQKLKLFPRTAALARRLLPV